MTSDPGTNTEQKQTKRHQMVHHYEIIIVYRSLFRSYSLKAPEADVSEFQNRPKQQCLEAAILPRIRDSLHDDVIKGVSRINSLRV